MRRIAAVFILITVLFAGTVALSLAEPRSVPGEILVKFKAGTPGSAKSALHRQNGSRVIETAGAIDVARVTAPRGRELGHARKYGQSRWVEFAEPNYVASISTVTPSDPYFQSNQWDLQQIQAPAAWDITCGVDSVIVAVVDTGVDYTHPDLAERIVAGYDFRNGDSDPMDDHGHGTAVAGVIGASTDNGIGVAGVTWLPKIMPIKVASPSGSAAYYAIARGITYAADNGARVVNISMAGSMSSSTLTNAVDYAYQRRCLVVAASGNNATSIVYYPAGCPNALAVGASDQYDQLTSYSNYGSALDVVAPGSAYTTTRGGGYGGFGGTSSAAPHAAGVAALVTSVNSQLSAAEVANIVAASADDLETPGWDQHTGWGRVNAYNAVLSTPPSGGDVTPPVQDTQPPSVALVSPVNGAAVSGTVTLKASASDNVAVSKVEFFVDGKSIGAGGSSYSLTWDSRTVANGSRTVTAKAADSAGNSSTSSAVTVNVTNTMSYTQVFGGSVMARKGTKTHAWCAASPVVVKAELSWSGSVALELRLYDGRGVLMRSASSPSSPLVLDLGTLSAGSYTFGVSAVSGKARYRLTVTATSP